ncbi:thrombospondin type 3 repeat-containing protein [Flavitalea sp.]|nr:thrombospondin type 3 repeat-containing protein [Flavitalea sp.]
MKDKDNDGVADASDACPDVAGIASLKGCPDKDGDGLADKDDKCPEVTGLQKYDGCPINQMALVRINQWPTIKRQLAD